MKISNYLICAFFRILTLPCIIMFFTCSGAFAQGSGNGNPGIMFFELGGNTSTNGTERLGLKTNSRLSLITADTSRMEISSDGNAFFKKDLFLERFSISNNEERVVGIRPDGRLLTYSRGSEQLRSLIYDDAPCGTADSPFWAHKTGVMYLKCNSGRLGIGTANPAQRLDVRGGDVHFGEKLGIGVLNPTAALDVAGDIRASGCLQTGCLQADFGVFDSLKVIHQLRVGSGTLVLGGTTGGVGTADNIIYADDGDLILQSESGVDEHGWNTIINANNLGRVGIGTNAPERKLHVKGQTEVCMLPPPDCAIIVDDRNTTYIRISDQEVDETDNTNLGDVHEWDIGGGKGFTINKVSERVMFTIRNNRVGIGRAPAATLDVQRESGDPSGNLFRIRDGVVTKFVVADTRNVGIGIASPIRQLHVNETSSTWGMRVQTGAGWIDFGPVNTGFAHIYTDRPKFAFNKDIILVGNPGVLSAHNTNDLHFATNTGSNIRMTILASNGNVGIGTTNIPTGFRLAVAGRIIAEEVWTDLQADWPDYVFHSGYEKMSFALKEKYYLKNKRLPYMPSAKEVKDKGLNISGTMVGLTRNVEENRLDITELFARIEKVEKENEQLKKENQQLKKALKK